MKPLGLITTASLFLLFGAVAPAPAQQDQGQLAKPPKQEPTAKAKQSPPPRPAVKMRERQPEPEPNAETEQERAMGQHHQPPPEARPQTPQHPARAQTREHLAKAPQAEPRVHRTSAEGRRVKQSEERGEWQHYRAQNWQSEHRGWGDRGGYRGFRIPEARFRPYFGREHWFRIHDRPMVMVGRHPRFQYGGYWFSLVDPWPEEWSDNWYQADDVYIDYADDGYYLYNRSHPGVRVAVNAYED